MKGLIHLYTGDGKGKTTAAVGLSIRCAGSGGRVIYTQFLKDNSSSELKILQGIAGIEFIPSDRSFGFYRYMTKTEKKEAGDCYGRLLRKAVEEAKSKNCRMLVLDEIVAAYRYQLIECQYFMDFLKSKPESLEIVMTGRDPAPELMEAADYISEIKKIKHPYDLGVEARTGIEK